MRVTTGVDIIEVERIKKAIDEMQEQFLNRIYTEKEIQYCKKANAMQYQHFAARFAAKEAIFKALSSDISSREDILWKQIEIINEVGGRPKVNVDKLKEYGLKHLQSVDISLSHLKEYAVASAVAVFSDN